MWHRLAWGFLILIFVQLCIPNCDPLFGQDVGPTRVTLEWFEQRIRDVPIEELDRGAEHFTRQSCQKLSLAGKEQAAIKLWERCFAKINADSGKVDSHELLQVALEMGRLDLAERVLQASDSQRSSMLDSIALFHLKRGDDSAIKGYPHGEPMMTFYDAMELGQAYLETGSYDKLEGLLSDLKITEENDPEDVAGLLYEEIAKKARTNGNDVKAKKYIDKAFAVAGRQFYTGYAIEVTHRSIHGQLAKEVDRLADRALAYRGHMARELTQCLIRELINSNEWDTAERIALANLEETEDQARALAKIASEMAKQGDYQGSLALMRRIEDPIQQDGVRFALAVSLLKIGNEKAARELATLVYKRMQPTVEYEALYRAAAKFEGMCGVEARIEAVLTATDAPNQRALRLLDAFDGFLTVESRSDNAP